MEKRSGVYEIVNKLNGNRYIGSSCNIRKRTNEHKNQLSKGLHRNKHLQNAWFKYGEENFYFETVETVSELEDLVKREQAHINALNPKYNICGVAGSTRGYKYTPEAREQKSKEMKGRKITWGDKIREAMQGEKSNFAQLTEEQVAEAKKLYVEEGLRQWEIAERYGIGRGAIQRALTGRTWAHTPQIDIKEIAVKNRNENCKPEETEVVFCEICGKEEKKRSYGHKHCSICAKERDRESVRLSARKRRSLLPKTKKTFMCQRCGKESTKNSNMQKYCPDCAVEKRKEYGNNHYRRKNNTNIIVGEAMQCQRCGGETIRNSSAQKYCKSCSGKRKGGS